MCAFPVLSARIFYEVYSVQHQNYPKDYLALRELLRLFNSFATAVYKRDPAREIKQGLGVEHANAMLFVGD